MTSTHDSAETHHEPAAHAADPVAVAHAPAEVGAGLPGGSPAVGLLSHPAIGGWGNGAVRAAAIQQLQRTQGNRATQRLSTVVV